MAKKARLGATNLVIFGVSGDLAGRYILPALNELSAAKLLPSNFNVFGLSRRKLHLTDVLDRRTRQLKPLLKLIQLDMDDPQEYRRLKSLLPKASQTIFYFAIPPSAVLPTVRNLSAAGLNKRDSKLLLEKPFGKDLVSAKKLITEIRHCFDEGQVYRIDHYLAKEAAQNIAVFLGSNAVFREVWSNRFIEKIDIVVAEQIGIEGRVGFYESTGALRDIVQSHLLQLAALTLMTPCDDFADFERLPALRAGALRQLRVVPSSVVRAQYAGYKKEVENPGSMVETFAAMTLASTDPRWRGVPIRLVTGKNLAEKNTEIQVVFKPIGRSRPNRLSLRIQPREGIEFDLWVKKPGPVRELQKLPLSFHYGQHFVRLPDAYEQVLLDAFTSNHSLFASGDEVLEAWRIIQPIINAWSKGKGKLYTYRPGSSPETVLAKPV